ncbi:MAG: lytic murein transglycosylase [Candidatus Harrisonbacteria bacterium]|nr:lytic murein transglycosylase [Candidatus Harrisonbacteria bacterium]
MFRNRPRVLRDLYSNKSSDLEIKSRVNLSSRKIIKIPFILLSKIAVTAVVFSYLVFGSALAPVGQNQHSFAAENEDERQQLEKQLEDLEAQIANYQETVDQYKSKGKGLQDEISRLNAKINKLNLQVKAITLSLQKLNGEIVVNKNKISQTEEKIDQSKDTLTRYLQSIYEKENVSLAEILLRKPSLADFFADISDLIDVQESVRGALEKVLQLREDLLNEKEALAVRKNDAEQLKTYQDSQRASLNNVKSEKANLLQITKGNEEKYKTLLKETQKTAAQIRSQIFKLLGGGELPFGEAVKIAKVAESATGVRAAFTLAILTQESSVDGVIGVNLGKCYYNDPRRNPSGTVMSNQQKSVFLALMSELKLDPAKTPISCPIISDGSYGGAMGPAQFMPATWQIYKERVVGITGNEPPSPFNNADAFTATALYLKDGLTGCQSIYSTIFSQENCAAAKYYAGGSWRSYMRVGRYGYRVAERAADFERDIEILDASSQ